jgi:hypothetical protein
MSKIKMQNSSFYLLKNKIDFKIYYKLTLLIKKIIVSNMSQFSEEIQSILKRLNKLKKIMNKNVIYYKKELIF